MPLCISNWFVTSLLLSFPCALLWPCSTFLFFLFRVSLPYSRDRGPLQLCLKPEYSISDVLKKIVAELLYSYCMRLESLTPLCLSPLCSTIADKWVASGEDRAEEHNFGVEGAVLPKQQPHWIWGQILWEGKILRCIMICPQGHLHFYSYTLHSPHALTIANLISHICCWYNPAMDRTLKGEGMCF